MTLYVKTRDVVKTRWRSRRRRRRRLLATAPDVQVTRALSSSFQSRCNEKRTGKGCTVAECTPVSCCVSFAVHFLCCWRSKGVPFTAASFIVIAYVFTTIHSFGSLEKAWPRQENLNTCLLNINTHRRNHRVPSTVDTGTSPFTTLFALRIIEILLFLSLLAQA